MVCPPGAEAWPPAARLAPGERWETAARRRGADWAVWVGKGAAGEAPDSIERLCADLKAAGDAPIATLDDEGSWAVLTALLALHAAADEASAGAGILTNTPLRRRAAELLATTGSLARVPLDRAQVLPKLRAPDSGITLRSLSHHLALNRSEVDARWEIGHRDEGGPGRRRLTLLLVPYPRKLSASDFRPVDGPLLHMGERGFGFYEFEPQERLDPTEIVGLVEGARKHVGAVDAVVLPEGALDESSCAELQRHLAENDVPYLIAGVRVPAPAGSPFGGNYAYFGGADWQAPRQDKHHRWCLTPAQVQQYHLGSALDPDRRWWEAIEVRPRSLTFVTISDRLTICPLVCEDLARPDPVTDLVRAVGPTLVVGLLLDGPQLAARWPARYASVLADDPGSSVLTLTAIGMVERCRWAGREPSRVVALWKDPRRGLLEIPLADGARAVAVTAHLREARTSTADGRARLAPVSELVLSGIEQIA